MKLPKNISLEPVPFEEAIEYFEELITLTPAEFAALADEARQKAFMVSGVTRMDIVEGMHQSVLKALTDGETLSDFQNRIGDIFDKKGFTAQKGMQPWRLETIFRNNVQTAYNVGRHNQMTEQVDRFPYWEYDAVNDADTRPTHAANDGKIYRADHPFWNTWYPPNGHRCRCSVNSVHKYVVEEEGLKIETKMPKGKPDDGWAHNPAKEAWIPDLKKYSPELVKQYERDRGQRSEV